MICLFVNCIVDSKICFVRLIYKFMVILFVSMIVMGFVFCGVWFGVGIIG